MEKATPFSKKLPAVDYSAIRQSEKAKERAIERHTLTDYEANRLLKLLNARIDRRCESLRLYEPLPSQLEFHRSPAKERLAVGSNRSGKTTAACVEVAWAATGQHPHRKYPKGPLEIYLVAKDGRQIGEVWWHKLTQNAFYRIRDLKTKQWRAFRPGDPSDMQREDEKQVAPPLIPERFWEGEPAWEDKRLGIPKLLRLKNGTRIHFFTGNGKPPHGTAIHLAAFSEELGSELWYPEIAVRLAQHNGDFVWDATPQAGGEGLYELYLRSQQEAGKDCPKVTYHFMHIEANPHISQEARDTLRAKLTDPEQHAVRWEGKFPGSQLHIFPEWSEHAHVGTLTKEGWVLGPDCSEPHLPIPKDWTRYMVVDPGHTTCAVLFAAVPPPSFGEYVYIYDELYIQPCLNADHFAEMVLNKIQDDTFREFIVDSHGGRRTEEGSGLTVAQQYSRALARLKIKSQITGSSFIDGMDEVQAGNMAVHDWLHTRGATGDTKLRVLRGRAPNFVSEMKRYRKKRTPAGEILDEPYGKHDHLVSCIRYLRGRNPKWHKSTLKPVRKRDGLDLWNEFQAKARKKQGAGYVNLGPGTGQSYATR